jgi:hypothetical protein
MANMRIIFTFFAIIFATTLKAQTTLPASFQNSIESNTFQRNINLHDSIAPKKWFISSFSGISTGYTFFRGGGAGYFAAPFGFQLNRRISNKVYAFAGVTVAPAYVNFNSAFLSENTNKGNPFNSFYQPGNLSLYSSARVGLMYINDARTFSVSGSFSVERSNYPLFYNNRFNNAKQNNPILFSK